VAGASPSSARAAGKLLHLVRISSQAFELLALPAHCRARMQPCVCPVGAYALPGCRHTHPLRRTRARAVCPFGAAVSGAVRVGSYSGSQVVSFEPCRKRALSLAHNLLKRGYELWHDADTIF
jgi:hypothetical protein